MNNNFKILDSVLLSNNVVSGFYNEYHNNESFANWINDLMPEVKSASEMEQNNPWHIYNVLEHILHSVEEMNKLSTAESDVDKRMLAYTMFFHDIGKPETHIRRMKNGKMIDSFFNHNVASEKIAHRVLPQLDFDDDQIKVIKKLIYKHDIFMFIRLEDTDNPYWKKLTPQLIDEHIKDLSKVGDGHKLMRQLVMVGRADNLAQNPEMTAGSLKLLKVFDEMLENVNKQ